MAVSFAAAAALRWVNGSEETYAANRRQFRGPDHVGRLDRDNGELRFSMRSLEMHMPWFFETSGMVHFVHQNLPCWLDTKHPRLNLVHHRVRWEEFWGTLCVCALVYVQFYMRVHDVCKCART